MVESTDIDNDYNGGGQTWGTRINVGGAEYATSLFWQSLQNQLKVC